MKRKKRASLSHQELVCNEDSPHSPYVLSSDLLVSSHNVKKSREDARQEEEESLQQDRLNEFIEIMIGNLPPFLSDIVTLFAFISVSKQSLKALNNNHTWHSICMCYFSSLTFYPPLLPTTVAAQPREECSCGSSSSGGSDLERKLYWRDIVFQHLYLLNRVSYARLFKACLDLRVNQIDPFKHQTRGMSRDQIIKSRRHRYVNYDVGGVQLMNGIDTRNALLLDWVCMWSAKWRQQELRDEFLRNIMFNQSTHPNYTLLSSTGVKQQLNLASDPLLLIHMDRIDHLVYFTDRFREQIKTILCRNFSILTFEIKKYDYANGSGTIWTNKLHFQLFGCSNFMHLFESHFSYNSTDSSLQLTLDNNRSVTQLLPETIEVIKRLFLLQFVENEPDLDVLNMNSSSQSDYCDSQELEVSQTTILTNSVMSLLPLERLVTPEIFSFIGSRGEVYSYIYETLFYLICCVCLNIANRYVSIVTDLSQHQNRFLQQILDKHKLSLFNR